MKLRLRSFETKETLKLEVPNPCSLHHLKELVSQNFPSPAVHFSLNRKEELTPASPEESLESIGITSGDLIYFTTNPNGFSPNPQVSPPPLLPQSQQPKNPQPLNPNSSKLDETLNFTSDKSPDSEEIPESMEIDEEGDSVSDSVKSFSVPGFLRKVFTEELGDGDGLNHKLLGIAVRAVLLESGFVEIDPVSKTIKSNNFSLQGNNWHLASFYYTLPELINTPNLESVKIKFQNLGKYCKIYGCLVNGTTVHSVLIDEDKLVPFLNVVWANCGSQAVETIEENNRITSVLPEKEVFEFWRKVKDAVALPLLMDLCEKSGLELPPCFMRLPTELKLKILESVSGDDVAKTSCVCLELRYLASSEDLWKQKYVEQFGSAEGVGRSYKERFGNMVESQKRRRRVGVSFTEVRRRRDAYRPFGGDYDWWLLNRGRLRPGMQEPGFRRLRLTTPNCNLGGV